MRVLSIDVGLKHLAFSVVERIVSKSDRREQRIAVLKSCIFPFEQSVDEQSSESEPRTKKEIAKQNSFKTNQMAFVAQLKVFLQTNFAELFTLQQSTMPTNLRPVAVKATVDKKRRRQQQTQKLAATDISMFFAPVDRKTAGAANSAGATCDDFSLHEWEFSREKFVLVIEQQPILSSVYAGSGHKPTVNPMIDYMHCVTTVLLTLCGDNILSVEHWSPLNKFRYLPLLCNFYDTDTVENYDLVCEKVTELTAERHSNDALKRAGEEIYHLLFHSQNHFVTFVRLANHERIHDMTDTVLQALSWIFYHENAQRPKVRKVHTKQPLTASVPAAQKAKNQVASQVQSIVSAVCAIGYEQSQQLRSLSAAAYQYDELLDGESEEEDGPAVKKICLD